MQFHEFLEMIGLLFVILGEESFGLKEDRVVFIDLFETRLVVQNVDRPSFKLGADMVVFYPCPGTK